MPTPAVPTLTLCDQLVTVIGTAWAPVAPNEVSAVYDTQITKDTVSSLTGRKVFVIPTEYTWTPASRSKKKFTHTILLIVAERYADPGVPLKEWVDERVDFVYTRIALGLDYAEDGPLQFGTPQRTVWTETIEPVEVYVADMLVGLKLFWSSFEFTFGEVL